MLPPLSFDIQTARITHAASRARVILTSAPKSSYAFELSGFGSLQVTPLSFDNEKRMSSSEPRPILRSSVECQATSHSPGPSAIISGAISFPMSKTAFEFNGLGAVQVAPLSVERLTRMSPSSPIVPSRESKEYQTVIQRPVPSVAKEGAKSIPVSTSELFTGTGIEKFELKALQVKQTKHPSKAIGSRIANFRPIVHSDIGQIMPSMQARQMIT